METNKVCKKCRKKPTEKKHPYCSKCFVLFQEYLQETDEKLTMLLKQEYEADRRETVFGHDAWGNPIYEEDRVVAGNGWRYMPVRYDEY